jgi:RNA polymerase sigma-70 factor (ECF subfamily)
MAIGAAARENVGSATWNSAAAAELDMRLVKRLKHDPAREADFEKLYRRHASITFGFYLRKVGDPETAADLNQELYLRLSRSIANFDGRCSWRTWVFLVARTVLADWRRHRFRTLVEREVSVDTARLAQEADVSVAVDEMAGDVLLRDRLLRCLRLLHDAARAVIVGHYFDGVTLRELTDRLGLDNPSGSRGVLISAQRKLKRCIEGRDRS